MIVFYDEGSLSRRAVKRRVEFWWWKRILWEFKLETYKFSRIRNLSDLFSKCEGKFLLQKCLLSDRSDIQSFAVWMYMKGFQFSCLSLNVTQKFGDDGVYSFSFQSFHYHCISQLGYFRLNFTQTFRGRLSVFFLFLIFPLSLYFPFLSDRSDNQLLATWRNMKGSQFDCLSMNVTQTVFCGESDSLYACYTQK